APGGVRDPQLITDRSDPPAPTVRFLPCSTSSNDNRAATADRPGNDSAPEAQALDQVTVPGDVLPPEVVQQPSPPADHLQQPTPRVVVLGVGLQVFGQLLDAPRKDRDLNFGRAGIGLAPSVVADQRGL